MLLAMWPSNSCSQLRVGFGFSWAILTAGLKTEPDSARQTHTVNTLLLLRQSLSAWTLLALTSCCGFPLTTSLVASLDLKVDLGFLFLVLFSTAQGIGLLGFFSWEVWFGSRLLLLLRLSTMY